MTDLEPLLREHFSTEADDVPIDTNLLGGVDELRRSRRHRRLLAGGSVLGVAVLAVAIAVPVAVLGHHGTRAVVAVSTNQPAVPTTPPPGERAVTWAGIQLFVPATWTSGAAALPGSGCQAAEHTGGIVGYESDIPMTLQKCAPVTHPVLEKLRLGTFGTYPTNRGSDVLSRRACPASVTNTSSSGEFAGLPATCIGARVLGQLVTTVAVPSRGAVFTLTTNTQAHADAILDSAHLVSVDENGCAVDQPGDLKSVAGGGAGGPQVLGTPKSGVVCSYAGGRLVTGVTLSTKQLSAISADLDRLPARYTAAELAAQRGPDAIEGPGLASILLTDAGGGTQQISVRGLSPGVTPGVAGSTQSTLTQALSGDLSAALPTGFGANAFHTGPAAELPAG